MTTTRRPGRPAHPDILTRAESLVVDAVRHGLANRQIAERQQVGVDAIKYHVTNAFQERGFTRRTQARHWTGIRGDSPSKEIPMEADGELGPLARIARTVLDVAAATHWYSAVLGLPRLYSFDKLSFFDRGGLRLCLSEGATTAADSILYFRVADIRTAHAGLVARGVTVVAAPHLVDRHDDGTEEWLAVFEDHEGRPLALLAQVATM